MYYTLRTIKTLLVVALIISTAGTGFGQNLETMQPFDMVVPSTYGGGTRPNEGFYFGMDFMAAWISRPETATIGSTTGRGMVNYVDRAWSYEEQEKGDSKGTILKIPTITVNPNDQYQVVQDYDVSSYDTSMLTSGWVCARRYDVGYMWGHHGLSVSVYDINDYSQSYNLANAKVAFNVASKPEDPSGLSYLSGITTISGTDSQTFPGSENSGAKYIYGELGVMFDSLSVYNCTKTGGVELNYTYRFMPKDCFGRRYGIWEMDLGVRYFNFKEDFNVYGSGGTLADSWWNTTSTNNIIGPQIAVRYFRTFGRWTFDFHTKFLAGINNQSVNQNGALGTYLSSRYETVTTETEEDDDTVYDTTYYQYMGLRGYPGYMDTNTMTFSHDGTSTIFSPVIEFRFNTKLQLTQLVNLRMGYTCMYVGNIARAGEMVEYNIYGTQTAMGINMGNNKGDSLVHGFTIGLEVNR